MTLKGIDIGALSPAEKRRMLEQLLAQKSARTDSCPLASCQSHLYRLASSNRDNPAFNISVARRLRGDLNVRALQACLDEIVRRHETLRTRFVVIDGEPRAIVGSPHVVPLPVVQLGGKDASEQKARLDAFLETESRRPFDLEHGPIFRCVLLRLGEREHVLVRSLHRLTADGWAIGILDYEMIVLYTAFSDGRESPLSDLPASFSDFARAEAARLGSPKAAADIAFWKERLANAPKFLHHLAKRTQDDRPAGGDHVYLELPDALIESARALARREEVTLFTVFLAALKAVLANATGERDLVVGFPVANRDSVETKPLIGLVASLLMVRTRQSADAPFRALLQLVRDATVEAHLHADAPYGDLCRTLDGHDGAQENPFEVLFVLQLLATPRAAPEGLEIESVRPPHPVARFEFALTIWNRYILVADFEYATARFERATVERLAVAFQQTLEAVVEDPSIPLSSLPGARLGTNPVDPPRRSEAAASLETEAP